MLSGFPNCPDLILAEISIFSDVTENISAAVKAGGLDTSAKPAGEAVQDRTERNGSEEFSDQDKSALNGAGQSDAVLNKTDEAARRRKAGVIPGAIIITGGAVSG